jgi:hypothetical protein
MIIDVRGLTAHARVYAYLSDAAWDLADQQKYELCHQYQEAMDLMIFHKETNWPLAECKAFSQRAQVNFSAAMSSLY